MEEEREKERRIPQRPQLDQNDNESVDNDDLEVIASCPSGISNVEEDSEIHAPRRKSYKVKHKESEPDESENNSS